MLPALTLPCCRLGEERNRGVWSEEESHKLTLAVDEYLALKQASLLSFLWQLPLPGKA